MEFDTLFLKQMDKKELMQTLSLNMGDMSMMCRESNFSTYVTDINRKGKGGLSTGFSALDSISGGLKKGELIVLGARPAMGKSTFVQCIIDHVSVDLDKTSVLFSLESSLEYVLKRMIKRRANIVCLNHPYGELDRSRIITTSEDIEKRNLIIVDTPAVSTDYIRKCCSEISEEQHIQLIAIDYLQLLSTDGYDNTKDALNNAVRDLKNLAMELNCPILLLTQLGRNIETRADQRPLLSDIKYSDEIEEVADEIWILYRDDYYDKNTDYTGIAELSIQKCRNGKTGLAKFAFVPEISKFVDLETEKGQVRCTKRQ